MHKDVVLMKLTDSGTLIVGILFFVITLAMYINPELSDLSRHPRSSPVSYENLDPTPLCLLTLSLSLYFIRQSFKK